VDKKEPSSTKMANILKVLVMFFDRLQIESILAHRENILLSPFPVRFEIPMPQRKYNLINHPALSNHAIPSP
jgi:hypothetical protein